MQHIRLKGTSPDGDDRLLDCWKEDDGGLALWIHSPRSADGKGGWQVAVKPADIIRALTKIGVLRETE
jgi:hypothetical protein